MMHGKCRKWTLAAVVLGWVAMPLGMLSAAQRSVVPLEENRGYFVAPPPGGGTPSKAAPHKMAIDIQYDDGEVDVGYGLPDTVMLYDIVQRFDLPSSPLRLDAVELCFLRNGSQDTLDFFITLWAANGAGGGPGTLLEEIFRQAENIQPNKVPTFFTFDLSSLDVVLEQQTVYIGVGWSPEVSEDFAVCGDRDRPTVQPGFDMINLDFNWVPLTTTDPQYTALMVRGTFSSPESTSCTPDAETLCLAGGRFAVTMDFRTPQGQTGQGQGVQLTQDTGYFWFFNPENVEVVLKVLNACSFADRFWVFAGGLTNVEVEVTVTDTATGAVRTYTNPLNRPFQPIQDTGAFQTCP